MCAIGRSLPREKASLQPFQGDCSLHPLCEKSLLPLTPNPFPPPPEDNAEAVHKGYLEQEFVLESAADASVLHRHRRDPPTALARLRAPARPYCRKASFAQAVPQCEELSIDIYVRLSLV